MENPQNEVTIQTGGKMDGSCGWVLGENGLTVGAVKTVGLPKTFFVQLKKKTLIDNLCDNLIIFI